MVLFIKGVNGMDSSLFTPLEVSLLASGVGSDERAGFAFSVAPLPKNRLDEQILRGLSLYGSDWRLPKLCSWGRIDAEGG